MASDAEMRGVFVTFEGPEGAGKSTALRAVARRIPANREVVQTREPGSTEFGALIRDLLLHGGNIPAKSELFLFLADRANHVERVVHPALDRGAIVLCDRYADSTLVYQGYGRGLDLGLLRQLNTYATGGLLPDLTLLFDLPPEVGLSRLSSKDRLDAEDLAFHQRVGDGFRAEAARDPVRWKVIDANRSPELVEEDAWNIVRVTSTIIAT